MVNQVWTEPDLNLFPSSTGPRTCGLHSHVAHAISPSCTLVPHAGQTLTLSLGCILALSVDHTLKLSTGRMLKSSLIYPSLTAMLPTFPNPLRQQLVFQLQVCITTSPLQHMGIPGWSALLENGRLPTARRQALAMS